MIYSAHMLSNNFVNNCSVFAFGILDIYNKDYIFGSSINYFFDRLIELSRKNNETNEDTVVYMHDLTWFSSFILGYLNKMKFNKSTAYNMPERTYSYLCNDVGEFYNIRVNFCYKYTKSSNYKHKKAIKITFIDSKKKLNMSVKRICKGFNLEYKELEPINFDLIHKEIDDLSQEHIKNHLQVGFAIKEFIDRGYNKLTASGDAFDDLIKTIGENRFNMLFPNTDNEEDEFIRNSFSGGLCLLNKEYENKEIKNGYVLDKNSMYLSHMDSSELFPYGKGIWFDGEYIKDNEYPLYIVRIRVCCDLFEGHLPCIKDQSSLFDSKLLESTENEITELTLTSVDLEMLFDNYDVYYIEYIGGYKYKAIHGYEVFGDYSKKWYKEKTENEGAKRQIAKNFINYPYGRFAMKKRTVKKVVSFDKGVLKCNSVNIDKNESQYSYVAVASFTTAYSRLDLHTNAQRCYEMGTFIYGDTDSLHLTESQLPRFIYINEKDLGAWKVEENFDIGYYFKSKTYKHYRNGKWEYKCSGLNESIRKNILEQDFVKGNSIDSLLPVNVCDGKIYVKSKFTI